MPTVFPYLNYVAIGLPILFLVNIGFIFLWILIKWKYAVFFIILNIGFIIPINRTYNFMYGNMGRESGIKIISYNVFNFREDLEKYEDFFMKENPDIFMFQEYKNAYKTINFLHQKDFYEESSRYVSIRSRYPIVASKKIEGEANVNAVYADIKVGRDTIRVINVYLSSNSVDKNMIKKTLNSELFTESAKAILYRLKESSIKHQNQIKYIKESIVKSPYPVILGGDFNSVPNSYEYFSLGSGLEDAFLVAGKGLGTTFHGFKFPMRIDYLFSSPEIKATTYDVRKIKLSDHYPVIATFELH